MNLLEPFQIGTVTLNNRIVMAPLTRNRAKGTLPQAIHATYYQQRASAGLIISEATQISPLGRGYPDTPGIHSQEQVTAWKKVTDAVHAKNGKIYLQLWHVGRISHSSYHDDALPVSASAVAFEGNIMYPDFAYTTTDETPRALETNEIPVLLEEYRKAAQNAKDAGFDGVEIHAANGYLIEQFLRTGTNKRTDPYGGSAKNRIRLLQEVTETVLDVWNSKQVAVRLSPSIAEGSKADKDPIETYQAAAKMLNAYDLAFLHTVEADLGNTKASQLMRDAYNGTHLVTGGLTQESGEQLLKDGLSDLVGYGKLFISNPDLPNRFAENANLNDWDGQTFFGGSEAGFTDYPSLEEVSA